MNADHDVDSNVDTVVIGAGQAGLATSYHLTEQGRPHVVLDRGWAGHRWVTERWDSLRLLTPNWMSRLPGWEYTGPDPDGYMTGLDLAEYLAAYGDFFDAPVREETTVTAVAPADGEYHVYTDRGTWRAASVVVATGHCDLPAVPGMAGRLAPSLLQLTTATYGRPSDLPDGRVLVVGASASGVQIAEELHTSGRDVVLAAGRHTRLPRTYRGMDIMWWLHTLGALDRSVDDVADQAAARREPSLQLVGRPARDSLDLPVLQQRGVVLTGRLLSLDGTGAVFADDLTASTAAADDRLGRTLDGIDAYVAQNGLSGEVLDAERPAPFRPAAGPTRLDLADAGISTVVWATGYRRSYPWLHVPVLDEHGEIRQRAGITPAPGVYTVGQRFQTRRSSTFIDGVGHDAAVVAAHINALRPARHRRTGMARRAL